MYARMLTILLLAASIVRADAIIEVELVPNNPRPYYGGEEIAVDVNLANLTDETYHIRFAQLDFTRSDSALQLPTEFSFDYSDLDPLVYQDAPALPVPWTINPFLCYCPDWFLQLPARGELHLGLLQLQLPTAPGSYRLDALNASTTDQQLGFQLTDWEHNGPNWASYSGEITGAPYDFAVLPEPVTIFAMILSALMLQRRCRRRLYQVSAISLVSYGSAYALDPYPINGEIVPLSIDSGWVSAPPTGSDPVVVFFYKCQCR